MNKIFRLTFLFCFSLLYPQKKELKLAQKLFKQEKVFESKETLISNSELILNSDDSKLITQYHLLLGQIAKSEKEFSKAFDNFKLAEGNNAIKETLKSELEFLLYEIQTYANEVYNSGDYKVAAFNYNLAFKMSPDKTDLLYYAAVSSINGNEYKTALAYYEKLKELNYTGIITKYFATPLETGIEKEISDVEFSLYKKSKDYENVREENTKSVYPNIIKSIALLYDNLGMQDKAIQAVEEARSENPTDVDLILTEANINFRLGNNERYSVLVEEALKQDPNNATLYYNLGVVSSELGKKKDAQKYYNKAIELDPKMQNAYLNVVSLILEQENIIVEEMNSLGTSRAENKKYDELKLKRESIYMDCVPILQKLIEIDSKSNIEAIQTLKNIYATVGDTEGFSKMKALLEEVGSN
jgi:tetratricopeptide (TPR) repeat protein